MEKSCKKAFVVYNDWCQLFGALESDAERGRLIMALFDYAANGGITLDHKLSGAGNMALLFMSAQLDRDMEKWEAVCKRNAENARRRWDKRAKSNATAYD